MPRVRQAVSRHRQVGRRTVNRQITANESASCGTVTVVEDENGDRDTDTGDSDSGNGDNGDSDSGNGGGDGGGRGLVIAGVAAAGLAGVALSRRS